MADHCHLTMPGILSRPDPLPSTLDVSLDPAGKAFLKRVEAAGGRLYLESADDRHHARSCQRRELGANASDDQRCFSISLKGRAWLARMRSAT